MTKLITLFKIPELRLKIGITLLFLCIYRIGYHVPLPFINQEEMNKQSVQQGALGQVLSYIAVFSGGTTDETIAPSNALIFDSATSCLARMPYSSEVRSRAVASRHELTSTSPR